MSDISLGSPTSTDATLSACRRISIELVEAATNAATGLTLAERWTLVRLAIAVDVAAARRAGVVPLIGDGVESFREAAERAERGEHEKEPTLPEMGPR